MLDIIKKHEPDLQYINFENVFSNSLCYKSYYNLWDAENNFKILTKAHVASPIIYSW